MRDFPVMLSPKERKLYPDCPQALPWELVEQHENQARANHGQTLERLAERGGLCPRELFCVMNGLKFSNVLKVSLGTAVRYLALISALSEPSGNVTGRAL